MTENNETKWVEVEQVGGASEPAAPAEAPAAFNAVPSEAPAAFSTPAPEAPEMPADPFDVEPKLNQNVYGDAPEAKVEQVEAEVVQDPFGFNASYDNVNGGAANQESSNPYGGAPNPGPNGSYTYHKEGHGTYQSFDQNAGGYNAGGNYNVPPAHQKAVSALVLSIVGLCCCGVCGLIGLIFSIQAKNEGNNEGICKAAYIIGIIDCVLWAIGIIAKVAFN